MSKLEPPLLQFPAILELGHAKTKQAAPAWATAGAMARMNALCRFILDSRCKGEAVLD